MKELSIEEKAKAYDEAIAHAKLLLKTIGNATLGNLVLKNEFENMFPKLKESEDERIRKDIVFYIAANHKDDGEKARWLYWLEKQGKQKPAEYTLEQAANIFLDALSNSPYNNKPITDAQVITRELLNFLSDARSYNPNAINEQKPAWSEEEECMLNNVIDTLKPLSQTTHSGYAINSMIDWLKFLRPQNRWKPSDEQINTLEYFMHTLICNKHKEILFGLYADLKKLREE